MYLANFDFCTLGMTTVDTEGEQAAARKRTTVLTNSRSIAEVLRLAQCDGRHKHECLMGGRANACEVYQEKFVRHICVGIRKDFDGSDLAAQTGEVARDGRPVGEAYVNRGIA